VLSFTKGEVVDLLHAQELREEHERCKERMNGPPNAFKVSSAVNLPLCTVYRMKSPSYNGYAESQRKRGCKFSHYCRRGLLGEGCNHAVTLEPSPASILVVAGRPRRNDARMTPKWQTRIPTVSHACHWVRTNPTTSLETSY
jgi:hypothetical protein